MSHGTVAPWLFKIRSLQNEAKADLYGRKDSGKGGPLHVYRELFCKTLSGISEKGV